MHKDMDDIFHHLLFFYTVQYLFKVIYYTPVDAITINYN